MKATIKYLLLLVVMFGSVALVGCDSYSDNQELRTDETPKDLSGVWQLSSVTRNGIDISDAMDFSSFRLHLNTDKSYELENYLPFVVKKNGTWQVDDPQYPFHLIFQETGASSPVKTEISYPVVDGKRQVSLTLSPGHSSNKYKYVFVKVTQ
jgi:hypothetical protein